MIDLCSILGERLSDIFWCILGMNLHLFECLNDEKFPVFFSPLKMRELFGTLRSRWALYFSEVVPS